MQYKLILIFILFIITLPTYATFYIRPSYGIIIDNDKAKSTVMDSKTDETETSLNLSLGYIIEGSGWLFQVNNLDFKETTENSNSLSEISISGTGYGLGWTTTKESGFFVIYNYYSGVDFKNDLALDYKSSGYQFEIGYKVQVKRVGVGFHLTYQDFNFEAQNSVYNLEYSYTDLYPAFDLWFTF